MGIKENLKKSKSKNPFHICSIFHNSLGMIENFFSFTLSVCLFVFYFVVGQFKLVYLYLSVSASLFPTDC